MLIRDAELRAHEGAAARIADVRFADVRIGGARISEIGRLAAQPGEPVVEARGGALLPGLHDHHIHLFALAAARQSVFCGPPEVMTADALAARLAEAPGGDGWLRGTGYHEQVAGEIDRVWLDRQAPARPVRIQHRGGRRWIVNSAALDLLLADEARAPPGVDLVRGHIDDGDAWLRERLAGDFPDLSGVSGELARHGVTGVTEMTPGNDAAAISFLAQQQEKGALLQSVVAAGRFSMPTKGEERVRPRYSKVHLHEARLPAFDDFCGEMAASHATGRPMAVHCVTLTELVFALAAFRQVGAMPGDRIEHASVTPDEQLAEIAALGLIVVTQPNFVLERGDAYLRDVEADEAPFLYRCAAFLRGGVALAGGTDAPFGRPDPWAAMRAAVDRRTAGGAIVGAEESLSPEQALGLFLGHGDAPGQRRNIEVGAEASLCLLDRPWAKARDNLRRELVTATIIGGRLVFEAAMDDLRADGAQALARGASRLGRA